MSWMQQAADQAKATGQTKRLFGTFWYATRNWSHKRRVVVKAEHLGDKANPRFVVTSVKDVKPRDVYEALYCPRGQAENAIKDFKRALAGDRLSCTTYVANAFRLALHAIAYRLMDALRRSSSASRPPSDGGSSTRSACSCSRSPRSSARASDASPSSCPPPSPWPPSSSPSPAPSVPRPPCAA
jgi:hypothetical protein